MDNSGKYVNSIVLHTTRPSRLFCRRKSFTCLKHVSNRQQKQKVLFFVLQAFLQPNTFRHGSALDLSPFSSTPGDSICKVFSDIALDINHCQTFLCILQSCSSSYTGCELDKFFVHKFLTTCNYQIANFQISIKRLLCTTAKQQPSLCQFAFKDPLPRYVAITFPLIGSPRFKMNQKGSQVRSFRDRPTARGSFWHSVILLKPII